MIEIEPLRSEHLERFEPETPLEEAIPPEQIGKAVVYLKDGEVLGICGGWDIGGGTAEVGLAVSAKFRKYPVAMHKAALEFHEGLRRMNYRKIYVARPDKERPAAWLLRLGFTPVKDGFEKCLKPRS